MRYVELFTPPHIAILSDWLAEDGTLSLHIHLPHSGGAGKSFPVMTLRELRDLVAQQAHPEIVILVFRKSVSTEEDLDRSTQLDWVYSNSDKVLYLAVTKNRNSYEPYAVNEQQYAEEVRDWFAEKA
jgi:hypothetical protein